MIPIVHPLKDHGENDPSKNPVETPEDENIFDFIKDRSTIDAIVHLATKITARIYPKRRKAVFVAWTWTRHSSALIIFACGTPLSPWAYLG